jgi:G protein beta subunit-like protein
VRSLARRGPKLTPLAATLLATPEPDVAIRSVSISGDGARVFIGTDSGRVHQWAPPSCETMLNVANIVLKSFEAHDTYLLKLCVSPDLKYLATASADHTCKIWKISDMRNPVKILAKHQLWVWDVAFSADSSYLVTASSDHSVRLWDLNGEQIRTFSHAKAVVAVALNDSS